MSKKILQWSNIQHRASIKGQLECGTIFIGSTDTVLGLFAPCNFKAKQKLDIIKSRSDKPYIILINSLNIIDEWTNIAHKEAFLNLVNRAWPGPLTVLLKANQQAPLWLQGINGTLAFRWPQHEAIEELLTHFGVLLSTSANFSGHATPHCYAELDPYFLENFSHIILESLTHYATSSSTILDCTVYPFKVVRAGAYKI